MCGRYFFNLDGKNEEVIKLRRRVDQLGLFDFQLGEVFPTQSALVVSKETTTPDLNVKTWGIRGYKDQLMINARIETLKERASFSRYANQRCLIICNGFYEWIKNGKKKDKIYIQKKDRPICYMAGIFNNQNQFVILTGESQNNMASIHTRTPLIIEKSRIRSYLNNEFDPVVDNEDFIFVNLDRKDEE